MRHRILARAGSAIAGVALAAAAASISGTAVANATVIENPSIYLIGNTVYFSYGNMANCSMDPNGNVGCDVANGTINWYGLPTSNISIDLPFLPAHPAIGPLGEHGRPGSAQLSSGQPGPGQAYPPDASLTYGGATCIGSGFRGEVTCNSKGHSFSFGFTTGYN